MSRIPQPNIRLSDDEGILEYTSPDNQRLWSLRVRELVLVAEYTTNEGPFLDDYFVVFVTAEDAKLNIATASFYCDGCAEVIEQLSKRLKANIELQLFASAEWKSRVVWPPELLGREYFEFKKVPSRSWLEKLRRLAFGPARERPLSPEVREFLKSRRPKS